ncbi:hypothetical protein SHKM778_10820 [Streptomyces sp. KM77-8]|uniref:Transposase IS200-like domain-containing protein n=1 Tax=Streptomyces haneummycinicus TaxID=3074435 RepID=A0AAT9HBC6_9ACTN
MGIDEHIRTGRHCVFRMHVHLVFVTKYRHKIFADRHLTRCEEIMRAVCEDFEAELVEFNGENNHVHLLVNFPPKVAVSKLVNSSRACPRAGSARSSPTSSAITGGHNDSGPARTSPGRSAVRRSAS